MRRPFLRCTLFAGCTVLAAQSAIAETANPAQATRLFHNSGTAWQRPLVYLGDSDSGNRAPIARAVLDSHVLATARFDLADLRVEKLPRPGSSDSIQAIGFQVSPATQRRRQCAHEFVAVERLGTRIFGDTAFEAIYAVSDSTAPAPTRITLGLDARDFEVSLTVATAPLPPGLKIDASKPPTWSALNGLPWKTRLFEEALYDYARIADVRREQADWGKQAEEYAHMPADRLLRIRVSGLTQTQRSALTTLTGALGRPESETFAMHSRLVRIESIRFSCEVCRELAFHALVDTLTLIDAPLPVPPASTLRDPATPYTWTPFVAGGLPLRALHFRVGSRHFLRSAVVTGWPVEPGPRDGDSLKPWTWSQLGQGELQRIDWGKGGDGRGVDSALRIPVSITRRMRYLALGTLDRDDTPIRFVGVRGEVSRLNLEFAVEPEPAGTIGYRLRYAGPESTAFASDFSALLRRAPDTLRREMRLGPPEILKVATPSNRRSWLTGQTLFTLGLGAGIAVLVGFLLLAIRQAKPESSREKSL